jgi:hypothetical protein
MSDSVSDAVETTPGPVPEPVSEATPNTLPEMAVEPEPDSGDVEEEPLADAEQQEPEDAEVMADDGPEQHDEPVLEVTPDTLPETASEPEMAVEPEPDSGDVEEEPLADAEQQEPEDAEEAAADAHLGDGDEPVSEATPDTLPETAAEPETVAEPEMAVEPEPDSADAEEEPLADAEQQEPEDAEVVADDGPEQHDEPVSEATPDTLPEMAVEPEPDSGDAEEEPSADAEQQEPEDNDEPAAQPVAGEALASEPAEAAPRAEVSVGELCAAFLDCGMEAHEEFQNRSFRLTGIADTIIIKDIVGRYQLALADPEPHPLGNVFCTFEKKDAPLLARVEVGREVTVDGTYFGFTSNIILTGCSLVS